MQDTTHISSSSLSLLDTHFSGPSHLSHAYVGGLAGLLMDVVLHPLDTVRTRMKTNVHESVKLFSQIRTMHTNEGALSFSKGFTCTLAGAFVANGAYFYVYEKLRYMIKQQRALPNDVTPFVAAFAGALVSNCVYYPFIVIRTRMQLNTIHYDYAHFFDGIRNALKHEGVRKIYTGSPVFFLQTAIDMSLTFGFYELLHRTLEPIFPSKSEVNVPLSIASSVGAASLSAIIVNPFDVVVSRMQTMNTSIHGPCSVGGMIRRIYHYEGVRGFMKGVTGTMSHYSLAALILFPTYEILGQYYKIEK